MRMHTALVALIGSTVNSAMFVSLGQSMHRKDSAITWQLARPGGPFSPLDLLLDPGHVVGRDGLQGCVAHISHFGKHGTGEIKMMCLLNFESRLPIKY